MRSIRPSLIMLAVLTGCLAWAAACGGSAQTRVAPSTDPPTAVSSAAPAGSPAANQLSEVATDNKFSQTSLNVRAGETYTLTMLNKGQVVHNLRIENVKAADGKDVAVPLIEGGKSASVTFSIAKAGTYQFVCDVHPDEMKGTITVGQASNGP